MPQAQGRGQGHQNTLFTTPETMLATPFAHLPSVWAAFGRVNSQRRDRVFAFRVCHIDSTNDQYSSVANDRWTPEETCRNPPQLLAMCSTRCGVLLRHIVLTVCPG